MTQDSQLNSKLSVNVITLFPDLFTSFLEVLPFKKAIAKDLVSFKVINLRNYALDSYGSVDDKPYGGGVGMVMMIEPIFNALCEIYSLPNNTKSLENGSFLLDFKQAHPDSKIILLDPKGTTYSQQLAEQYTKLNSITLICGRYEGVDERVSQYLCTDRLSIGNYVLAGGESAALVVLESVVRLFPGVLDKQEALAEESHMDSKLEYPQYTRPENFKGLGVPQILLSGDHAKIKKWRERQKETVQL